MCILNLVALPCLTMFYTHNHIVFWVLLVFLDIANFILLDQKAMIQCLLGEDSRKQHHKEFVRLLIYVFAYVACLIYIAFTQPILLVLIILGNDILESGLNVFIHKLLQR